jgi:hypothetical protein
MVSFFTKANRICRTAWGQIRRSLLKLFLHPAYGGVATVAGVFAGYLGSHYDDIVFRSYYPAFWPNVTLSWEATSFYILTFIFGASFTGTYWAQAVTSKESNADLHEALDKLVTVPPRGFLEKYQQLSLKFHDFSTAFQSLVAAADEDEIKVAIRTELEFVLKVARSYDSSAGDDAVYGANIMVYLASGTPIFTTKKADLERRIKCIEAGVDIERLSGVLDLQRELSVRSDTGNAVDDKLTDLALPVPQRLPGRPLADHPALIPGAPFSFAIGAPLIYGEQGELVEKVRNSAHFTTTVKTDLEQILLAQAKDVQTLICIPLYPTGLPGGGAPVAVLNIHKNQRDPKAVARFTQLLPMLSTMTRALANLVAEL